MSDATLKPHGSYFPRIRKTIGLLIDWIGTPYHVEILNGMKKACQARDYNLLVLVTGRMGSTLESEQCRNMLFELVTSRNADAYVITSSSIANLCGPDRFQGFLDSRRHIPMITIGQNYPGFPSVGTDNEKGMEILFNHLRLRHNYSRFGFIKGPNTNLEASARWEVFQRLIKAEGLKFWDDFIFDGDFRLNTGQDFGKDLLSKDLSSLDCIICANDTMALGIMQTLREGNRHIPHDYHIAGFDDIEISRYLQLTTVRQNFYSQAKTAVGLIEEVFKGNSIPMQTLLEPSLVIRESCGCFQISSRPVPVPESKKTERTTIETSIAILKKALADFPKTREDQKQDMAVSLLSDTETEDEFLTHWKNLLYSSFQSPDKILSIKTDLDIFFNETIEGLKGKEYTSIFELWQTCRGAATDMFHSASTYNKIFFEYQFEEMNEIGEKLFAAIKPEEVFQKASEELPRCGIHRFYLSLFEDPQNPCALSHLMLAIENGYRYTLPPEGIVYPTVSLIPQGLLPDTQAWQLIVENLFHGYEQIGLAIFEITTDEWKIFELLRNKLSIAIKTAGLIDNVRKQAASLEIQVQEKTKDLIATNQKLSEEILEREKIEQELMRQKEHFREIALLLPNILVELDTRFRLTFLNYAALQMFGIEAEDMEKSPTFPEWVIDDDVDYAQEFLEKILTEKTTQHAEIRIRNKNEEKIALLLNGSTILKNGQVRGIRLSGINIKPFLSSIVMPEELFFKHYHFSPRVKEVLILMLQGYKTKDISKKLFISENTVKAHIRAIYTEVGVSTRAEFYKILEEYQVNHLGYESYVYSLLNKLITED